MDRLHLADGITLFFLRPQRKKFVSTGYTHTYAHTRMINPHLGLAFGCCVAPAVAAVCGLTFSSVNTQTVKSEYVAQRHLLKSQ